jgi:hypothetical protein
MSPSREKKMKDIFAGNKSETKALSLFPLQHKHFQEKEKDFNLVRE